MAEPAPVEDSRRVRLLAEATRLTGWCVLAGAVWALILAAVGGDPVHHGVTQFGSFDAVISLVLAGVLASIGWSYLGVADRVRAEGRGAEGLGVIGWTSLICGAFAVGPMHSDEWGDLMDRWAIPSVIAVVVFGVHGAIVGAYNRGGRAPVREAIWWVLVAAAVIAGEIRMFTRPPLAPHNVPAVTKTSTPVHTR